MSLTKADYIRHLEQALSNYEEMWKEIQAEDLGGWHPSGVEANIFCFAAIIELLKIQWGIERMYNPDTGTFYYFEKNH